MQEQQSYDTSGVGSHLVEHSGKDIINIAGSPARPSEGKEPSGDQDAAAPKGKKDKATDKKKGKGKDKKKGETTKPKDDVEQQKSWRLEEMKDIKYNRLVFGEGSKDRSVHDKFRAYNRQARSATNLAGRAPEQPKPRASAYEKWLVDNGLRQPQPAQNLNKDLAVFYPALPQYQRVSKSKMYQKQLDKTLEHIDKLKQAKRR